LRAGEFLRRAQKLARKNRWNYRYDPAVGKGSHGRVILGGRQTTIKGLNKELGEGLLNAMCKQLGIDKQELY